MCVISEFYDIYAESAPNLDYRKIQLLEFHHNVEYAFEPF